jgi:hypothetical protein
MIITVKRYDVQILKGVVNAAVGQENGSREHLKIAQQYFQLVGGKSSSTKLHIQCLWVCSSTLNVHRIKSTLEYIIATVEHMGFFIPVSLTV